jgi:exopolysaccharide production protein ExoQ
MGKIFYNRLVDVLAWAGDAIVFFCGFVIVNISAFPGVQFPDVSSFDKDAWWILPASSVLIILMIVLLLAAGSLKDFGRMWLQTPWVLFFLAFAVLSIIWTVYLPATLYELNLLIFSTFLAAYIAIRRGVSGSINLLTGVAMFCIVASFYVVFFTQGGVMKNRPFIGSWNGMFWHRNHTGSLMAFFSMIFLVRVLMDKGASILIKWIYGCFYILSVVHVFGSKSAAGILIYFSLNLTSFVFYVWLRIREKLGIKHYTIFWILVFLGFAVFLINADFFFGLLGRNSTLTGRVPLWKDLFSNFYLTKPFFGYGYGALWMQESFRTLMQTRHGWTYQVYFADNGFFDILLNLGIAGLSLFLIAYLRAFYNSIRTMLISYSWQYIFLFTVLLYGILANIAYSFLLEVDQFVWMWILVVIFLLRQRGSEGLIKSI